MEDCLKAGFELRNFYASLHVESIIGLVASQSGIALIMENFFQYHKYSDVIAIHLLETIESKIVLAYPKDKKLSAQANIFLEFNQD